MSEHAENPLQSYYEWQVTTFMLAYDLSDPIPRTQSHRVEARRNQVEDEVKDMVLKIIPRKYQDDPTLDWPPELMMQITRATLKRAGEIAGV